MFILRQTTLNGQAGINNFIQFISETGEVKKDESFRDTRDVTLTPMQIRTYQVAFTPR